MDWNIGGKRQKNPRENASVFSILTFAFTFSLFKKSLKQDINDNDIYEVLPSFASKKLGDTLENNWKLQKKRLRQPSLYRALFDCFAKRYLLLGAVHLVVKIILIFIQPLAMSKVICYFQPTQTKISRSDLYLHAGLIIGLNIFGIIYNENYYQFVFEEGIKMRTAMTTLIYRKVLRLDTNHSTTDTMGKVVTLITKDVMAFEQLVVYLNDMWIYFIEMIVVCVLIYSSMGYSMVLSIGFSILMFLLQCYFAKKSSCMRMKSARCTDKRLQIMKQALSSIKMLKIYSRESSFQNEMNVLRRKELNYLASISYIQSGILVISLLSTTISFFLIIITYIWTGNFMDTETLCYTNNCFSRLKEYFLNVIPNVIAKSADVRASVERITQFLNTAEVAIKPATSSQPRVFVNNLYVEMKGKQILEDVSLSAEKGLYLVTGTVGSGKTSVLKAILGEYTAKTGQIDISGSISYASENYWLFPSTIRQNIIFGQKYNNIRYKKVCSVCLLDRDFNSFEKGDQTFIGDYGISLSRGQQTRISLARAVYRDSDIYLLDDSLAHLDFHTRLYISKRCLMEFLKDKIVILTTRNADHVKLVYAQQILLMEEGKIHLKQSNDSVNPKITNSVVTLDPNDSDIGEEDFKEDEISVLVTETTELLKSETEASSNMYYEEKQQGKVRLSVYQRYYKFAGGPCILSVFLLCYCVFQIASSYNENILSQWVEMKPNVSYRTTTNMTNSSEYSQILEDRDGYLKFHCLLTFVVAVLVFFRTYLMLFYSLRASMKLHTFLASSILNSLMPFFDRHYIGNIMNRFSKDLSTVDEMIPSIIHELFKSNVELIGLILLLASVNAILLIPSGVILILISLILKFYLKAGRSIKKLESSARSPMIGHLNATLESLSTVRTFGNQAVLIEEFERHQDHFTSANYSMNTSMRALSVYGALVCSIFVTGVILNFIFLGQGSIAGDVGLVISLSSNLASVLFWSIRQFAELETHMTATERILEYTDIADENKKGGQVIQNWPDNCNIEFRDLSLTYSSRKHRVLNSLNFIIRPNEKIGIVGRTGMGKSSIVSSLLRLYNTEGSIIINDVDIDTLSLQFLRSKISVIAQNPKLFSGTVRSELDPEEEFSDEAIWNALEAVHMKHLITDLHARFTDGGRPHFSYGQKYLICLARAIVRRNKIIILDQPSANSNIYQLIQTTIKNHFSDCTVFVIAHTVETVMNLDRVMVVDQGGIVELDSPSVLLRNHDGVFYGMVQQERLPANQSIGYHH